MKTKIEMIEYLARLKPYLNLSQLCESYNSQCEFKDKIDYNNLRNVINKTHINRLSEEKLYKFIEYNKELFFTYMFSKEEEKDYILNKIKNQFKTEIDMIFDNVREKLK